MAKELSGVAFDSCNYQITASSGPYASGTRLPISILAIIFAIISLLIKGTLLMERAAPPTLTDIVLWEPKEGPQHIVFTGAREIPP